MSRLLHGQFVGMDELRKTLGKLLDSLAEEGHEVVVTRQGKPAAVLLDVERYLELQQALQAFADPDYLAALLEARREIRTGEGVAVEEVFAQKGL
jgi:antitoxin YefM